MGSLQSGGPLIGGGSHICVVKVGAWEVEVPSMDVHADETGLRPDPSATAIFERPGRGTEGRTTGRQQQLFMDAYPTYADTDKIPVVSGRPARAADPGPAACSE